MFIPINMDDVPLCLYPKTIVQLLDRAQAGDRLGFMAVVEKLEGSNPDEEDARARMADLWTDMRQQLGLTA